MTNERSRAKSCEVHLKKPQQLFFFFNNAVLVISNKYTDGIICNLEQSTMLSLNTFHQPSSRSVL